MNNRNKSGPNMLSCGIPDVTAPFSDETPSTTTCCIRFVRNDEIH